MAGRATMMLVLVSALMFAPVSPASATLSVVGTDPATGEVGVAAASCVQFDLARIAAILPGVGAAVSQGRRRPRDPLALLASMRSSATASEALARVASGSGGGSDDARQYAVVMIDGGAATSTGGGAAPVAAEVSDDTVAVVGSDMAGRGAAARAETAFRHAPGDLADRLIAGLKAASAAGGDGRCHSQTATSAFIIVAGPRGAPVVPVRGLPEVAQRRRDVLKMVGDTVAADELGDLLRDAAGLRRPTGPGAPDLYLSLIQPARGFNAATLLAQAYRQLISTSSPSADATPSTPTPSARATTTPVGDGSAGTGIYLGVAAVLLAFAVGMTARSRRRRATAGRAVRTKT